MENNTAVNLQEMRELNPAERAEIRNRYQDCYFPHPVLEPVFWGKREKIRIPDKKAIVDYNATEFNTFGICSDDYKIIPYEDIIGLVEQTVSGIKNFGKIEVKPSSYLDGARLRVNLSFPEKKISIVKGDNILPKIEIFSSHDLSTKLKGRFGAFQLKCSNGMGVWKTFKSFAKRHLQNLYLADLSASITEGLEVFELQTNLWKEWSELKIPQKIYEELWADLPFSTAEKARIEVLPEIGTKLLLPEAVKSDDLNLWSLNSVLTQFATHEVKSELRKIDLEPMIAHSMENIYQKVNSLKRK